MHLRHAQSHLQALLNCAISEVGDDNFADALRDTDSGDALRERLMGHSNDSTFSRYGLGDQIRKLHAVIAQIRVPEVIEREKERLTLSLKRTYEH